ncbi:MAG: hypothetical protein H0T79_06180 [Deltaproteobacteria bacterium]|nr:hypothetical protein [Deltaproteobacteria bacterium]
MAAPGLRPILAILAIALAAGCTQPRSARCKEVCKKEADCVDTTGTKLPFDEKECIAACSVLEADVADSAAKVARHAECVHRQTSCTAVLECP